MTHVLSVFNNFYAIKIIKFLFTLYFNNIDNNCIMKIYQPNGRDIIIYLYAAVAILSSNY